MIRKYVGQKKLSELTEHVVIPCAQKHGFAIFKIVTNWGNIVGDFLSLHSTPKSLQFPFNKTSNGVLHISVENPGFSLELQASEKFILHKISSFFGYQAIDRIVVEISRTRKKNSANIIDNTFKDNISSEQESIMLDKINSISDNDLKKVLVSISSSFTSSK